MAYKLISFEQWKKMVDAHIMAICGMISDDLPDYCYYDCYTAGDSPNSTAKQAIKAAKDY